MTAKLRRDRCAIENAFVYVRSYPAAIEFEQTHAVANC